MRNSSLRHQPFLRSLAGLGSSRTTADDMMVEARSYFMLLARSLNTLGGRIFVLARRQGKDSLRWFHIGG